VVPIVNIVNQAVSLVMEYVKIQKSILRKQMIDVAVITIKIAILDVVVVVMAIVVKRNDHCKISKGCNYNY